MQFYLRIFSVNGDGASSSLSKGQSELDDVHVCTCMGVFTNVCKMCKKKLMGLLYVWNVG